MFFMQNNDNKDILFRWMIIPPEALVQSLLVPVLSLVLVLVRPDFPETLLIDLKIEC